MIVVSRFGRITIVVIALLFAFALVLVAQGSTIRQSFPSADSLWPTPEGEMVTPAGNETETGTPEGDKEIKPETKPESKVEVKPETTTVVATKPEPTKPVSNKDISFDLTTPPSTGCEALVNDLQQRLIQAYSKRLEGIRYVNVWGYLETENKGDAAIWSAQQILLSMLGIETMEACRFIEKGCDMEKFKARLEEHKPHSAIIMAGGGNFNDYYWEDQPSRMKMIETFTDVPVRAFPQSIFMTRPERINATKKAFGKHNDLQLAARDKPSHDWLVESFGNVPGIETDLVPDIAFMWGNRSDYRVNGNKTHDVLILARKDAEISDGASDDIAFGEGHLDLGPIAGKVTYRKVDWKFTETPGIDPPKKPARDVETREERETGKNQRAWAKANAGFELLGSAKFVMTDRLHGHILSTLIGVPHVLMDSKLGKNVNFHNTWTRDCECTRVTTNITQALDVARLWFEQELAQDEDAKAR